MRYTRSTKWTRRAWWKSRLHLSRNKIRLCPEQRRTLLTYSQAYRLASKPRKGIPEPSRLCWKGMSQVSLRPSIHNKRVCSNRSTPTSRRGFLWRRYNPGSRSVWISHSMSVLNLLRLEVLVSAIVQSFPCPRLRSRHQGGRGRSMRTSTCQQISKLFLMDHLSIFITCPRNFSRFPKMNRRVISLRRSNLWNESFIRLIKKKVAAASLQNCRIKLLTFYRATIGKSKKKKWIQDWNHRCYQSSRSIRTALLALVITITKQSQVWTKLISR